MIPAELKKIPYNGVGIGLRARIAKATQEHLDEIEVLEIISEHHFGGLRMPYLEDTLNLCQGKISIVPHGVKLSIGSAVPLEKKFLEDMRDLAEHLGASYYSDHFALTRQEDTDTGHLSPLWYTREMLEHVSVRIGEIQSFLGKPLVLENITAPFIIPGADYEEPEFITEVCRRTGCGLLLDLTNIHINAFNQKRDGLELLSRYPMDHVVHLHLAGGELHHGHFEDTHSQELNGPNEGVWELLEWTARNAEPKTIIIERDENFKPDFEEMILKDLRRAKTILEAKNT